MNILTGGDCACNGRRRRRKKEVFKCTGRVEAAVSGMKDEEE